MPTSGRGAPRLAVHISVAVWREEVERFDERASARRAAERERARLERDGLRLADMLRCDELAEDGTRLGGLLKVYVPIAQGPPSRRPFGMVLSPETTREGALLVLVAFGERHPRPGVRSVYERAHKRLHGRYPDQ